MRKFACFLAILYSLQGTAQELYVFTESASNIPANSISFRLTDHFVDRDRIYQRFAQRYMPQVMYGVNKNLMLRASATISDMHTLKFRYESVNFYAKYRFLSKDDIHRHFRMAVFAEASSTRAPFHYDEITLMGDKSGIEAGVIATQLWNKFALSASVSHTQLLDKSRNDHVLYIPARPYEAMTYSLSGGYLLLPRESTGYHQTNLNLYLEVLGQQTLDIPRYYIDLAPAVQLIFNSNTKLNIGHRFEIAGNMQRMAWHSWQVGVERTFFNAFRKNK